jgi:hypothetical protein
MLTTQSAKDTFYSTVRDRIAAGNASRTIVVRGVLRPAVLVVENEAPGASVDGIAPAETFCLRWLDLAIDTHAAGSLIKLGCEVRYASDGSLGAAALDRGRALAAMDAELANALTIFPMNALAFTAAENPGGGATAQTLTGESIFWSEPVFGPLKTRGERLERAATLEVFAYAS